MNDSLFRAAGCGGPSQNVTAATCPEAANEVKKNQSLVFRKQIHMSPWLRMHSNRIEQKVGKNLKLASGHERLSAGCNVSHLEIGEALKRE